MIYLQIFFALFLLVLLWLIVLLFKNSALKKEIKALKVKLSEQEEALPEVVEEPTTVKDEPAEQHYAADEIMKLLEAGESREAIAEQMGIALNKLDLIIKFDKIKKEKHS